jgi:hypothetical protein
LNHIFDFCLSDCIYGYCFFEIMQAILNQYSLRMSYTFEDFSHGDVIAMYVIL